jgi:adenosyl cobinamide kinase/adenosyl cobinamide phosphate guanylyltransferase
MALMADQVLIVGRSRDERVDVGDVLRAVGGGGRLGREYRDLLGRAHQRIAGVASDVYLMVAGNPLRVK